MAKTKTIDSIIADAQQVKRVFEKKQGFTVGEITAESLQADIDDLAAKRDKASDLRTQLTAAVNDAGNAAKALTQKTTRARRGIGAAFGLNSSEIEEAGGTRTQDRARPVRTTKTKQQ